MPFTLLEQFTQGKDTAGYSEDRLVTGPHVFGVLDGSRGPLDISKDAITQILDDAVAHVAAMPADQDFATLVAELDEITAVKKAALGVTDHRRTGGFVFCLYAAGSNEIWRVGDCKFRTAGRVVENGFEAEEICANARAMVLKSWLANGITPEDIMASKDYLGVISDLLYAESSFLNRPGDPMTVGAVIGGGVSDVFLERFTPDPGHLVITSDGYPTVLDTLAATEAALAETLATDPLCIDQNRQCKGLGPGLLSFDDRSYISADIG